MCKQLFWNYYKWILCVLKIKYDVGASVKYKEIKDSLWNLNNLEALAVEEGLVAQKVGTNRY